MNSFSKVLGILWVIHLWFALGFLALVSLVLCIFGPWPWGALFFIAGPITVIAMDAAHDESVIGKANGSPFHLFCQVIFSISLAGLIILTALTAFGVLHSEIQGFWSPETNFASWYMVGGLFMVFALLQRTEPNDDIPDLQRMEQLDRRSTRVGVVSAAIFAVLCLVVPLISLSATSYDSLALALTLLLTPWFLYFVRDGLFYLHHPHFEEGSEGYRTLRVVCIGMVGMSCCISLVYMINTLNRSEWLPALAFTIPVVTTGWLVKRYVTVGITIPENEDEYLSSHASVQEVE